MLPFLKHLSSQSQGWIALLIGVILVLGVLDKLNFIQGMFNMLLIGCGAILIVWGFEKANVKDSLLHLKKALHKK